MLIHCREHIRRIGSTQKTKTYYKRTSGKHMKAKPKEEEWGSFLMGIKY
jgi:hypothetical protein